MECRHEFRINGMSQWHVALPAESETTQGYRSAGNDLQKRNNNRSSGSSVSSQCSRRGQEFQVDRFKRGVRIKWSHQVTWSSEMITQHEQATWIRSVVKQNEQWGLVTQTNTTQIKVDSERISGNKDINNDQSKVDNNQSIAATRSIENYI